jgi:Protein of unknown function (DUF3574)
MKVNFSSYVIQSLTCAGLVVTVVSILSANQHRLSVALAKKPSVTTNAQRPCINVPDSKPVVRTELFFGLRRPDGSEVNNAEFEQFLDHEVTPRFPDGFTLVSGRGQFKNTSGAIQKERSRLLIILYPVAAARSQQIERIQKAYTMAFRQQSVLRTDELSCASF